MRPSCLEVSGQRRSEGTANPRLVRPAVWTNKSPTNLTSRDRKSSGYCRSRPSDLLRLARATFRTMLELAILRVVQVYKKKRDGQSHPVFSLDRFEPLL